MPLTRFTFCQHIVVTSTIILSPPLCKNPISKAHRLRARNRRAGFVIQANPETLESSRSTYDRISRHPRPACPKIQFSSQNILLLDVQLRQCSAEARKSFKGISLERS